MPNRILGSNSGIDVEEVVKASLTTEQNKIDKAYQQQKVYEYQQQQLKEIVKEVQGFYDKYLDILSGDSLLKSTAYETGTFTATNSSGMATTAVTAKAFAGADITNYEVVVTNVASKASATLKTADQTVGNQIAIKVGNKVVSAEIYETTDGTGTPDLKKTASELNDELKKNGINVTVKYSEFSGGLVIESGEMGRDASFEVCTDYDANKVDNKFDQYNGKNAEGTISKGGEIYVIDSATNVFTVDNIQFTLNSATGSDAVTLTGKTDISGLKDTIVGFVNDYNKIMESINEKLWETRDKDYMPLTEDQKKEMSESEIEAWEKKAKTGLLRGDSDLRRIQSAMKSAMSSMMSSTGLTLEAIGIEPVQNYTTQNGMYKIDDAKLTEALQNNADEVKDLFTRPASGDDKGGVLTQLQSVLKDEFKSSSSSLAKRIGFEGTSTESNNTLSKNILKQKNVIKELQDRYKSKENALFKKYSALEVMLEKLNAQTNSLYSLLGM